MTSTATPQARTWGDVQQGTLADLRPGDFLVEIPTQMRIAGVNVRSTVLEVAPSYRWEEYTPSPYRGRRGYRRAMPGVQVFVATPAGANIDRPAATACTYRKASN